jgi:hypothetical protein
MKCAMRHRICGGECVYYTSGVGAQRAVPHAHQVKSINFVSSRGVQVFFTVRRGDLPVLCREIASLRSQRQLFSIFNPLN